MVEERGRFGLSNDVSSDRASAEDDQPLLDRLNRLWATEDDSMGVTRLGGVPVGEVIGDYRVRALLGTGSFGIVYLADHVTSGHSVALKVPRFEVLLDEQKRKRFAQEATIASKLDHPGIVRVREACAAEPFPFMASQWCDGPDLGRWLHDQLQQGNALPGWRDVARLMCEIADAVDYAHSCGISHRDLKPANILLDRKIDEHSHGSALASFVPRVADFGLAKIHESVVASTRASLVIGTLAYMAPERLQARFGQQDTLDEPAVNPAADIYSLGAILFELLTGQTPVKDDRFVPGINASSRRLSWGDQVPKPIRQIVETCFRVDPTARYATAGDLAEDLRHCLSGRPIVGRHVPLKTRVGRLVARQNWLAIAGWFAVGSQLLFTAWMMLSDVLKIPFGLISLTAYLQMLPQLFLIACLTSFTVIAAGCFCIVGRRWAPWIGAGLAIMNLTAPVIAMVDRPPLFGGIYASSNPYFSFQIHLVIAMMFATQAMLFGLACVTTLRVGQRKSSAAAG